jgi:hypothetical protein
MHISPHLRSTAFIGAATVLTAFGTAGDATAATGGSARAAGVPALGTCLQVSDGVALFTAVVPEGQGNHAFYIKIIDGGHGRPDQIANIQAQKGPERPPRRCIDVEVEFPPTVRW